MRVSKDVRYVQPGQRFDTLIQDELIIETFREILNIAPDEPLRLKSGGKHTQMGELEDDRSRP